jgi:hypothetical protein
LDFGAITPNQAEIAGIDAAPIRLRNAGDEPGLAHIERPERLEQIKAAGYPDATALVSDVAAHFDAIYKGRDGSLILAKRGVEGDAHPVAFVELAKAHDGDYWDVRSALIARPDYVGNKELLWDGAQTRQFPEEPPSAVTGRSNASTLAQNPAVQQVLESIGLADHPVVRATVDAVSHLLGRDKAAPQPEAPTIKAETPEQAQAFDFAARNPDALLPTGAMEPTGNTLKNGEPEMRPVLARAADIMRQAADTEKQAQKDTAAFDAAVNCALRFPR